VLPGVGHVEGRAIADRVRAGLEDARPGGLPVTMSLGVASASGDAVEFEPLFRAADRALYEAKRAGRNRVVAAGHAGQVPLAA
jgi:diguanylate cyclase (GGDEF)-like protein